MYFFLQFFLSILPVFNWEHRTHSCLLPFIHQLHSPVPVCSQQELNWAAGLLHEASHFTPTLIPGGSSQGWLSTLDTPEESSVQVAPGFQGTHSLAGILVLCYSTRYFPCQQSSYFWLSQVSHECPAWAVCVKWHIAWFHWTEQNWWRSRDLEKKKNTSKRVDSWVSKVMLYKVFLWEILYDHFAEVSCGFFPCKYESVLWIQIHLLLQEAPSYSVTRIESRIQLSSEGQWFYSVLISYQTVLGVG